MSRRVAFAERSYQRVPSLAREMGCKRFISLWHRRAGKDRFGANFLSREMVKRAGVYWHLFPTLGQGRRDFWDNRSEDPKGSGNWVNMIDTFPKEFVVHRDDKEMQITYSNGAIYQIIGCDDREAVERQRGPNPVGLLISEYATHHWMKESWSILRPVLAENGGWAMFAYTPKGFNHGHELWNDALADPFDPRDNPLGWFTQKLTVDDTYRDAPGESGERVMPVDVIEAEKKTERPEFIRQEYYCDYNGASQATIYGDMIEKLEAAGHITEIPYVINMPVGVCFDLGKSDKIACWFYQLHGEAIKFIDYWEKEQVDVGYWVQFVYRLRPYMIGRIVLPWDGWQSETYLTSPGANFRNVHVQERTKSVRDSIDTVRRTLPRMYFDKNKCAEGIRHLKNYSRKWDPEKKVFSDNPVHDEHSHAADALRTGVEGGFGPLWLNDIPREVKVILDFDPREPLGAR